MQQGKINIVLDGQWGSTGKGKVASYLALRDSPDVAVCNFATNAGHWFRSRKLGDFLVQQLPSATINPAVRHLIINAGSAITLETLFDEIQQFEKAGIDVRSRLIIDRNAAIITKLHKEQEASLYKISSTQKGCGAAYAAKIMRGEAACLAKDVSDLSGFIACAADALHDMMDQGATVLGETAQGFDLSLNHGTRYPYVTSRDITPMTFLSDCGVPAVYLGDVYGVLRTFPIRVGNVYDQHGDMVGSSGPRHDDQEELTWEAVSTIAGREISERTTVTKKIRRVFSFSAIQTSRFVHYCNPSAFAINFCDYFPDINETSTYKSLMNSVSMREVMEKISSVCGVLTVLFGTGADNDAVVDLMKPKQSISDWWDGAHV